MINKILTSLQKSARAIQVSLWYMGSLPGEISPLVPAGEVLDGVQG